MIVARVTPSRADLVHLAVALLWKEAPMSKPVRLLGVSLSSLRGDDKEESQLGLFDLGGKTGQFRQTDGFSHSISAGMPAGRAGAAQLRAAHGARDRDRGAIPEFAS